MRHCALSLVLAISRLVRGFVSKVQGLVKGLEFRVQALGFGSELAAGHLTPGSRVMATQEFELKFESVLCEMRG